MTKYINYLSAGSRVLYDKTCDYVSYYTGYKTYHSIKDDINNHNDNLDNYNNLLQPSLYENEYQTERICPKSGYYETFKFMVSTPTHIVDNIYLGSAFNAASYQTLKNLNIKVIINATSEISEYYPNDFTYLRYSIYDNNKQSIKKYLEEAYNNILFYQKNNTGNILIHCFVGASRSASIVLYYLMKNKSYTFDEALNFLKERRPIVNPTFRLTKDLASSFMENKIL